MGLAALAMARNGDIEGAGRWPVCRDLDAFAGSLMMSLGGVTVIAYLLLGLIWSATG